MNYLYVEKKIMKSSTKEEKNCLEKFSEYHTEAGLEKNDKTGPKV